MLTDYIERMTICTDMEDLWAFHQNTMRRFGIDKMLYGHTFQRTATSLGDPQDWLILTNHKPSYIQTFLDEGMVFHAPMAQWALENTGWCSWGWLRDSAFLTASERRVLKFNIEHGVTAGYTISFKSVSSRTKAGIALTAREDLSQDDLDLVWKEHGRTIVAMNNIAHLKILNLPHVGNRRPLTSRQRETLEWVGDGKTTADIATIMGLTSATVEKHLRLAREVLDVETTAQAVLKASVQNQIFTLPA